VAILALSRVYQRRWRYVGQRDIELLVRSLVIATVLLVSIVALVHPVLRYRHGSTSGHPLPLTVIVVYFLLSLVFLSGARCLRALSTTVACRACGRRTRPAQRADRRAGQGGAWSARSWRATRSGASSGWLRR